VDASLWLVVTAHELITQASLALGDRQRLQEAMVDIVGGYARGTRYGIAADADGLLWAGAPGTQLTWMDAKVGDWVVTPRRGKPVEVQALWLTALEYASRIDGRFTDLRERAGRSFSQRFWNRERGMLFDVVDVDRVPGVVDASFRPNQVLAAGGLPLTFLSPSQAAKVVAAVERELYTPLGLRSLARYEADYHARYEGGVRERDGAYHQGTVWPWLLGPFVEAWVKAEGGTGEAKARARERFLPPLREHLGRAGLGHVSELTDAEPPHTPRGCPFQAWSLAELIRLERRVLAP
jgi:predicted glycogen debranching enzyme